MLILGIETSERTGSLALHRDGVPLAERTLSTTGRRHAQSLVAEMRELFREQEARPADCDLIAVSIGPGSFTGLRVGVVCAKTLAYAVGCAVAGIDTFLAIAAAAPDDVNGLWVIGNAQRQELFVGRYERGSAGVWRQVEPIRIVAGMEWCRTRGPDDVVSGPGIELFEAELSQQCRILPPELRRPTASHIAMLGEQRPRADATDDLWALEPFYLRPSAAEERATQADGAR
jgi:tRNA threonylcarbamoyladenosine biosynthesis protein TsaB